MASRYPPEQAVIKRDTLLEFPCRFPVKAMGRPEDGFESLVVDIVLSHAEVHGKEPVTTSSSHSGKYISITVTIEALSKDQLDRIYMDLTACKQVLVAL